VLVLGFWLVLRVVLVIKIRSFNFFSRCGSLCRMRMLHAIDQSAWSTDRAVLSAYCAAHSTDPPIEKH